MKFKIFSSECAKNRHNINKKIFLSETEDTLWLYKVSLFFFIIFLSFNLIHANEKPEILLVKAHEYIGKNNFSEAVPLLLQVINSFPDNPEYLNMLGSIYVKTGKFELAEESYKQATLIDSSYIKTYNNLGLVYIAQNKTMQGIKFFEQGLNKDSTYVMLYSNLALAYYNLKMFYKALDILERGMKKCPDNLEIMFKLAVLYEELGMKNAALKKYKKALIKSPADLKILTNLSLYYIQQELFSKAKSILEQIISISPSFPKQYPVYFYLGLCYQKLGDYIKAEKYLKKNLKIFSDNIETHYQLYCVYRDKRDILSAQKEYKKIIKLNPDFIFSTNALPEWKQIIEYSIILKNQPQNMDMKLQLAYSYYSLGLMAESMKIAENILNKENNNFDAIILKGLINYRRYKINKAKEIFNLVEKNFNEQTLSEIYKKVPSIKKILTQNTPEPYDEIIKKEYEAIRLKVKNDKENPEMHYEFGKTFEKMRLYDYAILEYLDAVLYKKNFISAYSDLIDVYLKTFKYEEALKVLADMLNENLNYEFSYLKTGEIYYYLFDFVRADEYLNKCLEKNYNNLEAHQLKRAIYRDKGEIDSALKEHKFILSINPEYKFTSENLSVEQAINEYKILTSHEIKSDIFSFVRLGKLYIQISEPDEAIATVEKVLEKHPDSIPLLLLKAEALYLKENKKDAEKIFNDVFKLDPRNPDVHFFLRNIYRDQGKIEKAVAEHKEILRLDPSYNFPVDTNLRFKEMIDDYEIILKINPDNAENYYQLANIYYSNGFFNQSEKNIKKCLSLNPENKKAQELLKFIIEIRNQDVESKGEVFLGARHILLLNLEDAQKVKELLNIGKNFDSLAVLWSKDKYSAKNGGDLGLFTHGKYLAEFEKAIEKLKIGEISNIIKTRMGYHIIKRTK